MVSVCPGSKDAGMSRRLNASKLVNYVDQIRDFQRKDPKNKRCVNCGDFGPTYVCMDFGTFICTVCAGLHRELNHRVKGVTMSQWTEEEVNFIVSHGNTKDSEKFLAQLRDKTLQPNPSNVDGIRRWIKSKYVDQRWVDSGKDRKHKRSSVSSSNNRLLKTADNLSTNVTRRDSRERQPVTHKTKEPEIPCSIDVPTNDLLGFSDSPLNVADSNSTFDLPERSSDPFASPLAQDFFTTFPASQKASAVPSSLIPNTATVPSPASTNLLRGPSIPCGSVQPQQAAAPTPSLQRLNTNGFSTLGSASSPLVAHIVSSQRYEGDPFADIVLDQFNRFSKHSSFAELKTGESGATDALSPSMTLPLSCCQRLDESKQQTVAHLETQLSALKDTLEHTHLNVFAEGPSCLLPDANPPRENPYQKTGDFATSWDMSMFSNTNKTPATASHPDAKPAASSTSHSLLEAFDTSNQVETKPASSFDWANFSF